MTKKIIYIFINIAAIYILCNISFSQGKLKEREGKSCIDPITLEKYERTLNIAELVCVGVQSSKREELNNCQEEISKWKNNYSWLKRQQVVSTTTAIN